VIKKISYKQVALDWWNIVITSKLCKQIMVIVVVMSCNIDNIDKDRKVHCIKEKCF